MGGRPDDREADRSEEGESLEDPEGIVEFANGRRTAAWLILARPMGGRLDGRDVGLGCVVRPDGRVPERVATSGRRGSGAAGGRLSLTFFVTGAILKKTAVTRRRWCSQVCTVVVFACKPVNHARTYREFTLVGADGCLKG